MSNSENVFLILSKGLSHLEVFLFNILWPPMILVTYHNSQLRKHWRDIVYFRNGNQYIVFCNNRFIDFQCIIYS